MDIQPKLNGVVKIRFYFGYKIYILRDNRLKYGHSRQRKTQGRNEQVRRVRLADGRRLWGASRIFPEFNVLYRETVNISCNLAFGRRKKNGVQKALGVGAPKWL